VKGGDEFERSRALSVSIPIKEEDGMGVYRRKDKEGKYYGPYIVQYPYAVDSSTGKTKYIRAAEARCWRQGPAQRNV
jgi:hypothetical protein